MNIMVKGRLKTLLASAVLQFLRLNAMPVQLGWL
jgi:hypothetical protein